MYKIETRGRKKSKNPRTEVLSQRYTGAELINIRYAVQKSGSTLSEYMRDAVLGRVKRGEP